MSGEYPNRRGIFVTTTSPGVPCHLQRRAVCRSTVAGYTDAMIIFIVILILLAVLGILGAVIEGLLWLTLAAVVLFVAGAVLGWFKFKSSGASG